MYLRTPKRYQVNNGRRRRHLIGSTRWLWLWILTPIVVVAGYFIYEGRDQYGPQVRDAIATVVNDAQGGIATIVAPTALPTTDPSDHIIRGDNAWVQGAMEQATDEYRQAAAGAPNDVRVHYRYTYGLIMEGQYAEALTAAENAVTANPFSADAWAIRALALEKNGRYPEAIASALQALSIDPKSATAYAFMSETYLDANQPAQAEEKANQAVNANPDSAEAHFARGRFYAESAFLDDDALADYGTAHDLAPNMPQVLVELAWINWRAENYDVGLDQLEQVVENNPNNIDALYALGFFQYQVYGDPNKAEDYLTRCVQSAPKNIPCLNYLATVQIGLGNAADAAQTYQRIIDAGTTQSIYYLRAGRTYATLNDCSKAIPLLRLGYTMERSAAEPNADYLDAFEEYMSQCGAPAAVPNNPPPSGPATEGAPLLIPLDGA